MFWPAVGPVVTLPCTLFYIELKLIANALMVKRTARSQGCWLRICVCFHRQTSVEVAELMKSILAVWRYRRRPDQQRKYSSMHCWIMNLVDRRAQCAAGCRWISPYGF